MNGSFVKTANFSAIIVYVSTATLLCGAADEPRIAKFPGDREAAVSLTFDDGTPEHISIAAPALEKRGMRGTFFLIAGRIPDSSNTQGKIPWPVWKELAGKGHEIGNHSMHHKLLTEISDEELVREINDAYDLIEEKIGQAPLTFCFPGNRHDKRVDLEVSRRHIAARTCSVTYGGKAFTLEKANGMVEQAILKQDWMVATIHGIKEGCAAFGDPGVFEAHLDFLVEQANCVAVDTFANIARYVAERDNAKLSSEKIPGGARLTLSTNLDKRYNVPLTIVILAPKAKEVKAVCKDDGKVLSVKLLKGSILLDIVPDGKGIDVTW